MAVPVGVCVCVRVPQGVTPGNVIFKLKQVPHPRFKREGNDLHMTMHISLREALLGFSKTFQHLEGRQVGTLSHTHTVHCGNISCQRTFGVLVVCMTVVCACVCVCICCDDVVCVYLVL